MRTDERVLHDRINLPRLVKRLEQAVKEAESSKTETKWSTAQATLQHIRHARVLLKNVELDDADPTPAQQRRYQYFATTLEHLEDYMRQVEQQLAPPARRPKPILPSIPSPTFKPPTRPATPPVEATLIPVESVPVPVPVPVQDLLPTSEPGPSHATPVSTSSPNVPAPSVATPSPSNITATPTILQNSRALQEQLSEQLALMATQLRRNATHFSESLEKDKSVVVAMQEKVENNFEFMKRERTRLRDLRGKAGGTTCLVIMSIVVVLIAFVFMVFVIRLT